MPTRFPIKALMASALLVAVPQGAQAASYQWDVNGATAGLGGTGSIGSALWDDLSVGNNDGTDAVTTFSNLAADTYNFGGTAGTVTLGGTYNGTYNINSNYTFNVAANGTSSFTGKIVLGANVSASFTAGGNNAWHSFSAIDLGSNGSLSLRAPQNYSATKIATVSGVISGNGTITIHTGLSDDCYRFNGNNTYTGTTNVQSGGPLQLGNVNALGDSTLNVTNGGLSFLVAGNNTYKIAGLSGSAAIAFGSNALSIGANNSSSTYSGVLSGTGGITKVGTGTLTLSGANTYSGGTTVSAGTLAGDTTSLQGAIVNNAAVSFSQASDGTYAGAMSGTGSLTKSGAGVLTLSGTSTYTGATTISAGRLNLTGSLTSAISVNAGSITGSGSTTGSLTTAGGTSFLLAGGATTAGLTANGVTFGASTALDFAATPNLGTTYDVVTYGAGGLTGLANLTVLIRGTMTNTGTKLTFATPDAFVTRTWSAGSGTWSINGAANFAEGDQKFFNTDHVVFGNLSADTTVTLSGLLRPTSVTVSNASGTYTFAGTSGTSEITGSASLTKSGAGTLVLGFSHSYTGGTTINGGTLQFGSGGSGAGVATSGNFVVNAGGALRVYQGSGALVAPTWASITGAGVLALNKDGTGTTNKDWGAPALGSGFTGTLWIEEGRVSPSAAANLGGTTEIVVETGGHLGVWTGGTFSPNLTIAGNGWGEAGYEVAIRGGNPGVTATLSGNVALAASAALGASSTGFLVVNGAVTGAAGSTLTIGASSQAGTVTLNGANTYFGNTTIAYGTLNIGSAGTLGAGGTYAGAIANAGTLTYASSAAQTFSGVISGAGALSKETSSAGKLTLSGANSYSGTTTVRAGELVITGSSSGASRFIIEGTSANAPVLTIAAGAGAINTNAGAAFVVAGAANTVGTVNMAGGTLTANHELWLGDASGTASGKFYLTGGTVEVKNWTAVGRSGVGLLEISGGLWKNTTAGNFAVGTGTGGNNSSVVNVKGTGVLEVIGRTLAIRESTGANSQGTLNLSESGVVKATTVSFGLNSAAVAGTGNLNISGGNLWANTINRIGTNTAANISLSGGTLGALDADAAWSVNMGLASGTTTTFAARDFAGTSRTLTVSGALSGAGALSKAGNGILILSAANTHTGGTTVTAGTLQAGHAGSLNGSVTLSGGNLTIGGGIELNVDGGLTFAAAGTVSAVSGSASLKGSDVATADIIVNTGITGSIASSVSVGTGTGGIRFDVNGTGALSVAGALAGTGSVGGGTVNNGTLVGGDATALFKRGAGDLTLTGASTFTAGSNVAATSLQEGRLLLSGGDNRLPTGSAMYLGSSANTSGRLVLVGVNQSLAGLATIGSGAANAVVGGSATLSVLTVANANDYTFAGALGGAGANENNLALVKSGAGVLTLLGAGSYTGGTTVSAGTLVIGDIAALGTGVVSVTGGVLNLGGLNIANTVNVTGGTLVGAAAYTGTANVAADLTLSTANAGFSGTLAVSTGTLTVGDNAALGSTSAGRVTIADGATLDLNGKNIAAATLTLNGSGILGSGALVNNAGTAATHGGAITLASTVTINGTGDIALTGVISGGTSGLIKDGTGTLTLAGVNTYTGVTSVTAGKLVVNGTVAGDVTVDAGATLGGSGTIAGNVSVSGAHNPGNSPGVQTISGSLSYASGSSIGWELNGNTATQTSPSATFDQILVGGNLDFNGATSLVLSFNGAGSAVDWTNPFWSTYHTWTVFDLDAGSITGASNFSLSGASLYTGLLINGSYVDSSGTRTLSSVYEHGGFYLQQVGNDLRISYTPVPEPSTYGLGLGALALVLAAVRRRCRAAA